MLRCIVAFFVVLLVSAWNDGFSQSVQVNPYQIQLSTRNFVPTPGISDQRRDSLRRGLSDSDNDKLHLIMQLYKTPDRYTRTLLRTNGVDLLSPLKGNAWIAVLRDSSILDYVGDTTNFSPLRGLIRYVEPIRGRDKQSALIRKGLIPAYSQVEEDKYRLKLRFHKDIDSATVVDRLAAFEDVDVIYGPGLSNDYIIIADTSQIDRLSELDELGGISTDTRPRKNNTEDAKVRALVNPLYEPIYGLSGMGVQIGMWEEGILHPSQDHPAFNKIPSSPPTSRILDLTDPLGTSNLDHAAHIGGIMAGFEATTATIPDTLLHGIAHEAEIAAYDFLRPTADIDVPEEYIEAMTNQGIDLANNSWSSLFSTSIFEAPINTEQLSVYVEESEKYDQIVKGLSGGTRPIPLVFSVGNERGEIYVEQSGSAVKADYRSIPGPGGTSKNTIVVGAVTTESSPTILDLSSWGPTADGRLKPDLVAPGGRTTTIGLRSSIVSQMGSDIFYDDFLPDAGIEAYGTSMAAPMVTGTVAMMIEASRMLYPSAPDTLLLPSTYKAALINSAGDIDAIGPDYKTGYGMLNAQGAVDVIKNELFVEEVLTGPGIERDQYYIDITSPIDSLLITLVWDDMPSDMSLDPDKEDARLINNLDMELKEVLTGVIIHPYILDPNNPTNAATQGVDLVNNVEQIRVDNPGIGRWEITVRGSSIIMGPNGSDEQNYSLVSNQPFVKQEHVRVVQVLDRSGSMASYHYMVPARTAAENFVQLMRTNDEVGVVSFDDRDCLGNVGLVACIESPLELITDLGPEKQDAVLAIQGVGLTPGGFTSIGAGMLKGQELLNVPDLGNPHAMVLLTDGFENRPPWVEDKPTSLMSSSQPNTPNQVLDGIPDHTQIFTVALGPTSDPILMNTIADARGGDFYSSPDVADLLSIYYQIQADASASEAMALERGSKMGGNDTYTILLDSGLQEVTFALGWLENTINPRLTSQLELQLIAPDGSVYSETTGQPRTHSSLIQYERIPQPKPGLWEIHITRSDQESFVVDYTLAALGKGSDKLWSFTPTISEAGSCLHLQVDVKHPKTQIGIRNATVTAVLTTPKVSSLTLNHQLVQQEIKVSQRPVIRIPTIDEWYRKNRFQKGFRAAPLKSRSPHLTAISTSDNTVGLNPIVEQDPLPNWSGRLQRANQERLAQNQSSIFQSNTIEVRLFDDGRHNDLAANDGIYAICIDTATIAGASRVRFDVVGIDARKKDFQRTRLATSSIYPSIVDGNTSFLNVYPRKIHFQEDKGNTGVVSIVPMDRFGNVIGAGQKDRISVKSTAGSLKGELIDNGDGYYFQQITSNGQKERGEITVTVDDITVETELPIVFGDLIAGPKISLQASGFQPQGDWNALYEFGIGASLGLGYQFLPSLSLMGYVGYQPLRSQDESITPSSHLYNLSANVQYLPLAFGSLAVGLQGGAGIYIDPGGNNRQGVNTGLVAQLVVNSSLAVEANADLHSFPNSADRFLQYRIGLTIKL